MAVRKEAGAAELVTLEEWKLMRPWAQGFVFYMQAEREGSPLRGLDVPYAEGTKHYTKFQEGQHAAMLECQEAED